jgi:probable F420-dependent oxidoreductase
LFLLEPSHDQSIFDDTSANLILQRIEECIMKLGRLGVWYSTDKLNGAQLGDLARTIEKNGYSAFWYPEARGYESMSLGSYLLSKSEKLVIGSSIANIYARDPYTACRAMVSMNDWYGGRFILGLGVSHIPMVEGLRGHRYDKPLGAMRAYLEAIEKGATKGTEAQVVVAALGPKMLELSAAKSMGAVPYNVTPEHTAQAAKILGPGKMLAVEQKVTIETDPVKARALGRKELARYMTLPNYRNNWLRIGLSEAELADGGSDRFIDAMCLWGDAATVKKGLRAHFDAGATHVCLQPVHADGDFAARDKMLEALADT